MMLRLSHPRHYIPSGATLLAEQLGISKPAIGAPRIYSYISSNASTFYVWIQFRYKRCRHYDPMRQSVLFDYPLTRPDQQSWPI